MAAALNRIEVERAGGDLAVIRLDGEHDLSTASALEKQLEQLAGEGRSITVDLEHTTFVDSSILSTLLAARDRCREAGVELMLAVPASTAPAVRRVVELTGLADAISLETAHGRGEGAG